MLKVVGLFAVEGPEGLFVAETGENQLWECRYFEKTACTAGMKLINKCWTALYFLKNSSNPENVALSMTVFHSCR